MPKAMRLVILALAYSQPLYAQVSNSTGPALVARPPASSSTPASPASSRPSSPPATSSRPASSSDEPTTTVTLTLSSTTTLTTSFASSSSSIFTGVPGCSNDCAVNAEMTQFFWIRQQNFTTTITAATKLIIIDDEAGTTSTSLIFNDLPDGYTLPPMNEAGTQTWDITYTRPGETTPTSTKLTFPQEFTQYPLGYSWTGTFPIVEDDGQAVCLTGAGTSSVIPYPSYATPAQPTPNPTLSGDNGLTWSSVSFPICRRAEPSLLPNDPVINGCQEATCVAPVGANPTASFLTETSTTRVSGSGGTTANPAPTNNPGPAPTPQPVTPEPQQPGTPNPPPANTPNPPANTPNPPANTPAPPTNIPPPPPANTPNPAPANPAPAPGTTANPPVIAPVPAPPPGTEAPAAPAPPANTIANPAAPAPVAPSPDANTPVANPAPAPATQPTVVGGQTIVPVAPVAPVSGTGAATPPSPPPAVEVGGQTLSVGSTIVVGTGSTAQTVALQTNSAGNPVVVVAGTSSTSATLATVPTPTTSSGNEIGNDIAGGLGETRTSSSGVPAQQTENAAFRMNAPNGTGLLGTVIGFFLAYVM